MRKYGFLRISNISDTQYSGAYLRHWGGGQRSWAGQAQEMNMAAKDPAGWYYVGNAELRYMDTDG